MTQDTSDDSLAAGFAHLTLANDDAAAAVVSFTEVNATNQDVVSQNTPTDLATAAAEPSVPQDITTRPPAVVQVKATQHVASDALDNVPDLADESLTVLSAGALVPAPAGTASLMAMGVIGARCDTDEGMLPIAAVSARCAQVLRESYEAVGFTVDQNQLMQMGHECAMRQLDHDRALGQEFRNYHHDGAHRNADREQKDEHHEEDMSLKWSDKLDARLAKCRATVLYSGYICTMLRIAVPVFIKACLISEGGLKGLLSNGYDYVFADCPATEPVGSLGWGNMWNFAASYMPSTCHMQAGSAAIGVATAAMAIYGFSPPGAQRFIESLALYVAATKLSISILPTILGAVITTLTVLLVAQGIHHYSGHVLNIGDGNPSRKALREQLALLDHIIFAGYAVPLALVVFMFVVEDGFASLMDLLPL